MRYVVTGGAGMIGSALVKRLLENGHEVIVIDNLSRGREENLSECRGHENLALIWGCASSAKSWDLALEDGNLEIDGIFHLAARIGGVGKMYSKPFDQARNIVVDYAVIEWAEFLDCRLVYASTACVYPTNLQTKLSRIYQLREEDAWPARPESLYGMLKLAGEEMIRAAAAERGLEAIVARMFNAVGPEHCDIEDRHVVPALLGKLARGDAELEVWGDGSAERSFLDARDAAEALELCMVRAPAGETYNVGTEWRLPIADVARLCIGVSKTHASIRYNPDKPAGVHGRAADLKRIRMALGWKPRHTFTDTLVWVWRELAGEWPIDKHKPATSGLDQVLEES